MKRRNLQGTNTFLWFSGSAESLGCGIQSQNQASLSSSPWGHQAVKECVAHLSSQSLIRPISLKGIMRLRARRVPYHACNGDTKLSHSPFLPASQSEGSHLEENHFCMEGCPNSSQWAPLPFHRSPGSQEQNSRGFKSINPLTRWYQCNFWVTSLCLCNLIAAGEKKGWPECRKGPTFLFYNFD